MASESEERATSFVLLSSLRRLDSFETIGAWGIEVGGDGCARSEVDKLDDSG